VCLVEGQSSSWLDQVKEDGQFIEQERRVMAIGVSLISLARGGVRITDPARVDLIDLALRLDSDNAECTHYDNNHQSMHDEDE
jgi:hypothetical protein